MIGFMLGIAVCTPTIVGLALLLRVRMAALRRAAAYSRCESCHRPLDLLRKALR